MPKESDLIAIHEAAHAYAAVEMGLGPCIQSVTMRPACMKYFKRRQRPTRFDFSKPEWANLELIVCLAGPIGEGILEFGADRVNLDADWDRHGADLEGARHYANILAETLKKQRNDVLSDAADFTLDLLRDGWPTVEAIAAELLQRDLTGFEVSEICERHRQAAGVSP